jgi:hypothetical protein
MSKHRNHSSHAAAASDITAIESTRPKFSNMIPTANDFRNLSNTAIGAVKENPLGALLGGVAVGFLAGTLLPSTRVEYDRLGPLKTTLQTHAHTVGTQALEHGKAVVRDTIEAAQHSAQEHGAELAEEVRAFGA